MKTIIISFLIGIAALIYFIFKEMYLLATGNFNQAVMVAAVMVGYVLVVIHLLAATTISKYINVKG
jgi:hypothetical protein